jgi:hypothetical protein
MTLSVALDARFTAPAVARRRAASTQRALASWRARGEAGGGRAQRAAVSGSERASRRGLARHQAAAPRPRRSAARQPRPARRRRSGRALASCAAPSRAARARDTRIARASSASAPPPQRRRVRAGEGCLSREEQRPRGEVEGGGRRRVRALRGVADARRGPLRARRRAPTCEWETLTRRGCGSADTRVHYSSLRLAERARQEAGLLEVELLVHNCLKPRPRVKTE